MSRDDEDQYLTRTLRQADRHRIESEHADEAYDRQRDEDEEDGR